MGCCIGPNPDIDAASKLPVEARLLSLAAASDLLVAEVVVVVEVVVVCVAPLEAAELPLEVDVEAVELLALEAAVAAVEPLDCWPTATFPDPSLTSEMVLAASFGVEAAAVDVEVVVVVVVEGPLEVVELAVLEDWAMPPVFWDVAKGAL